MKKAFISILGTNDYLECRHKFGDIVTDTPVKYCQEDIIKIFCKDFDEDSEIRIFLTDEAKKKNWLDNGHLDKDKNLIPNKGLKSRLDEMNLKLKIIPFSIKEGFNEKEIWDIFQIIFESFRDDEEVVVDITHSFRSLPMLMITLLNYAKQVKRIKIRGIFYAAFESLGKIDDIRKIPAKERVAPILNLTPFSELQDWTNATYDFIQNANTEGMSRLLKTSVKNYQINDPVIKFFPTRVIKQLTDLTNTIALCRGKELLSFNFDALKMNIDELKTSEIPIAFHFLIDKIKTKIVLFESNPEKLILVLADWCLTHNLLQQAITLIQEFTITIILQKSNLDISNEKNRTITSQAFRIYSQKTPENEWRSPASDNVQIVKDLMKLEILQNLSSFYNQLTELRNDVNHSGFLNSARSVCSIKNQLNQIVDSYKKYLL
jgi:CRISPR-associated Csx2 family protein